eukprot:129371-Rhodomonas_salina.2
MDANDLMYKMRMMYVVGVVDVDLPLAARLVCYFSARGSCLCFARDRRDSLKDPYPDAAMDEAGADAPE